MTTVCMSDCTVNDTRFPSRRSNNYVNLYKWPESDAEFVKSGRFSGSEGPQMHHLHSSPRDSVSCGRQLYLRSAYTFSRKESVPEKTKKCLGRVKERVSNARSTRKYLPRTRLRRRKISTRFIAVKRVKDFSCEAVRSIFQRLLSCTATVDVEHKM
ncbi:hypothetical protein ACH5RR_004805 [Cinchona calisaya]|uniref:Ribosomal protein S10 n=1 Tax=Cinchona calisaya TaxID=153742 RepID=A0ABD3AZE5_9GENT